MKNRQKNGFLILSILLIFSALAGCRPAAETRGEFLSAELDDAPVKVVYFVGEPFEAEGAHVKFKYEHGEELVPVNGESCTVSTDKPGRQMVRATASDGQREAEVEFEIFVAERRISHAKSVQKAIDEAAPGEVVWLAAGTYHEHLVVDKDLSIVGDGCVLFSGPKEYAEIGEGEVEALLSVEQGATVYVRNVTIYPDAKKCKKLTCGRLAGMAVKSGHLDLAECKIRGFAEGEAIFVAEGQNLTTKHVLVKP